MRKKTIKRYFADRTLVLLSLQYIPPRNGSSASRKARERSGEKVLVRPGVVPLEHEHGNQAEKYSVRILPTTVHPRRHEAGENVHRLCQA
jgi:hypothetical protein